MKNKFMKSTIILIIGGFFTKLIGMLIRIITTRIMGATGMGLYSMIMPTFSILIAIAQLGLPTALNVLVGQDKRNNKNLVITSTIISLIIDFIIILTLILFKDFIAINLLHNQRVTLGLLSMGFVMPFITISNMLRSYFFGKNKVIPHVITNIIEDLVRLFIIIKFLPFFLAKGIGYAVAFIILTNILSELASIIIFIFLLPNYKIKKNDLRINKSNTKALLNISIPTTGSRLIGSIGYFLEPIIITFVLLQVGYSNEFIVNNYGIINGFVMQLVLLPSFFTGAISQALTPIISNMYASKKYNAIKKKLKQAITYSLIIGIPATLIFEIFPNHLLKLLFNTNDGVSYIRFIAPICLLHYIQSPISSALQAMSKAKISMKGTLFGMIIRTSFLFILSFLKIGMWGLLIATSLNIIFVTIYDYLNIKKILQKRL